MEFVTGMTLLAVALLIGLGASKLSVIQEKVESLFVSGVAHVLFLPQGLAKVRVFRCGSFS